MFGSRFVLHDRELSTFASILTLDSQRAFYRMINALFRSFALLLAHISLGCSSCFSLKARA